MDAQLRDLPVNPILPTLHSQTSSYGRKSSSKDHIRERILKGVMVDELRCCDRNGIFVVDPESFNLLISIIHENP